MNFLKETQRLCQLYGIKPNHSKGQNFLIDWDLFDEIVEIANLNKKDEVLEIGPGLGFLTEKLAEKVKKVVAVELDDKLSEVLKSRLIVDKIENVTVINRDILKIEKDLETIFSKNYKIVANLPYNITSFFLRRFLETEKKPVSMTLMLQKEVAERMAAKKGKMSLLGLMIQFFSNPEVKKIVLAHNFWPAPKVNSAIIKLEIKDKYKLTKEDRELFFRLAHFGFSAKRKKLKNNLAGGLKMEQAEILCILKKIGLNEDARAQDLDIEDWLKLFGVLKKNML